MRACGVSRPANASSTSSSPCSRYAYTEVYGVPSARIRSQARRSNAWRGASCRCAARKARTILDGSNVAVIGALYLSFAPPSRKRSVSVRLLALIPVAAAISLALSAAVDAVALPLFLDTTGTILATALGGPAVGVATGVLTSAVNTLRNPPFGPFAVGVGGGGARGPGGRRRPGVRARHPFTLLVLAGALPALAWILPAPAGGLGAAVVALALAAAAGPRRVLAPALVSAAPFWLFLLLLHDPRTPVAIGLRVPPMVAGFVWVVAGRAPPRL